ncbi:phosphohistidine phosphatase SixA [Miltoncostaea marina]|uniref:phosphohistidine phosphatase SixA n=1 Tax=Miltoncostaea marina TaxID=2843215 RepID=UPI001C3CBE41|nr:phosphohistidine phosphatase SixA [Miltoncostaea marina]
MRLLLLRHGIAEDAGPATGFRDAPRALTEEGAARMAQAARGMTALGVAADVVLSSPLTRCAQTAAIVCEALGGTPRQDRRLAPGMDLDALADVILEHPGAQAVLVCGHQPDLSEVVADLTAGGVVAFRRGSLAILDVDEPRRGGGRLSALYAPAALRAAGA